jgi:putative redox protein
MQIASVQWTGEEQFLAVMPSGHAVPFDADRARNTAPGPMEMLLGALGACTATDVVSILKKKRQSLQSLEVEVSGERAKEPPTVWITVEVVFRLRGVLDEKAVQDAIELSKGKYCSVAATLRPHANISFRYEILPPIS